MQLQIDLGSRTPIYVQIIECVKRGIASGELSEGTKLPPVRRLADELAVSKLTVFRAYTELQEAGLVTGRPGQGTVIAPTKEADLHILPLTKSGQSEEFALHQDRAKHGHSRDFSVEGPDPELFDFPAWLDNLSKLRDQGAWNFFSPANLGQPEMIRAGTRLLRNFRSQVEDHEVVVIGRGNEIASRLTQGLVPRGSHVLIQEPHHLGAEVFYSGAGLVPHGVAVQEQGIDLDHIELLVRTHDVKAAFVEPTFGNGDGKVWPIANRKAFLRLMHKNGVIVIERQGSAAISFVDDLPPTLANLAPMCPVITELPLSEPIAPGLGVGVAAIPEALLPWFEGSRRSNCIAVDVPTQIATAGMIESGGFKAHIDKVTPVYRARRDALVRSLWKEMPHVKVNVPAGGLALEITFPKPIDPHVLFRESLAAQAPVVPGRFLTTRGRGSRTAKIAFGLMTPEMSRAAVERLAPVIADLLGRSDRAQ